MESQRPVIVITGRRRPHELLFLALSVPAGILFLAGVPFPQSIESNLSPLWQNLWAAGLLVSGIIGIIGIYWRNNLWTALSLERSGMLLNAAVVFTYGVLLLVHNGSASAFAASFYFAWMAANVARSVQIGNDLRNLGRGTRNAH